MRYGKTQFDVDSVKSLTVTTFVKMYKDKFGDKTENLYYKITGFKPKVKSKKKSSED
jgi:hypothetical protein